MYQVLQNLKSGATELTDIPCPRARRGQLVIHTTHTLVSAGTERMLVDFGKAGLIDKARKQPDKVRMVLDKIRTDGLAPTLEAVRSKLDQPLPMGYCNVGVVAELGAGVAGWAVGDRVASNGKHVEAVAVPVNLCAKVPAGVGDEEAAFTVLGAIALQGIRLAQHQVPGHAVFSGAQLQGEPWRPARPADGDLGCARGRVRPQLERAGRQGPGHGLRAAAPGAARGHAQADSRAAACAGAAARGPTDLRPGTAVAESFGFKSTRAQRSSEVLMHRYYWAAKAVTQLNQILMLNIAERLAGSEGQPRHPLQGRAALWRGVPVPSENARFRPARIEPPIHPSRRTIWLAPFRVSLLRPLMEIY